MYALVNLSLVPCFFYDLLTSTASSGLIRLRLTHWSSQQPCLQVISPETALEAQEMLQSEKDPAFGGGDMQDSLVCCAPGIAEDEHGGCL